MSEKTWHKGVYDVNGNEVALVKVKSALTGPRRDADARLIAAAPALLEALEAIVAECKGPGRLYSGDSYLPEKFIEQARAAIAATKGQA